MKAYSKDFFVILFLVLLYTFFSGYYQKWYFFKKEGQEIDLNKNETFIPKSGLHVLPKETQIVLRAIDSLNLKDFQLYGSLERYDFNPLVNQRIHESAWPIRHSTESKFYIGVSHEIGLINNVTILFQYDNISVGTN